MIVELAMINVRAGTEKQFLQKFAEAQRVLAGSEGHLSYTLRRSIEHPHRFALTVEWRTLEDHTQGFRGSEAFKQWRALIGPFFESPPVVERFPRSAACFGDSN
jgi:heme-degrading monooxygenase HmoA